MAEKAVITRRVIRGAVKCEHGPTCKEMHVLEISANCCHSTKLKLQITEAGHALVSCWSCGKPAAVLLLAEDSDG